MRKIVPCVFALCVICLFNAAASEGLLKKKIWVERSFIGPPQCMSEEEKENFYLGPKLTDAAGNPQKKEMPMEPRDTEKAFKEAGIEILKKEEDNRPVCAACTVCPEYDVTVKILIYAQDLDKAKALGFSDQSTRRKKE